MVGRKFDYVLGLFTNVYVTWIKPKATIFSIAKFGVDNVKNRVIEASPGNRNNRHPTPQ